MALLTDWWVTDLLVVLSSLVGSLYLFYQYKFQYWKNKAIPQSQNPNFPLGNLVNTNISKNIGVDLADLYNSVKKERCYGMWMLFKPTIMIIDPELIKAVFVKDFVHFHDHGMHYDEVNDPLSGHLFALSGLKWKKLREKLTPTFTSGKMKMMFPILAECSKELDKVLEGPASRNETVDTKELFACLSTDVISSCAFGIQSNSVKNSKAEFRTMGRKFFEPTLQAQFRMFTSMFVPQIAALLKIRFAPKQLTDFFYNAIKNTILYREQNNVKRKDFLQLLIQLKTEGIVAADEDKSTKEMTDPTLNQGIDRLTMGEAIAQAFVFFLAGFETSSTTMFFSMYELALNQDIQDKTREDIDRALKAHGGQLTYEAVKDMKYLDMVVNETLRKYPALPVLTRVCTKPWTIPDTDVVIDEGVSLVVPILAIQNDERYYPNPTKFDPERFTEENKAQRHNSTFIPFGDGPRICIGQRFGLMQTKMGLVTVLSKYVVTPTALTPQKINFDYKSVTLQADQDTKLRFSRRA